MDPRAFSPKDAVALYPALGSTGTLANLRVQKRGPRFFKLGRRVIYRVEDVEAYLFARPVLTRDCAEPGNGGGR
jgi:hypothetical protein